MSDIPRALFSVGEEVIVLGWSSGRRYEGTITEAEFLRLWTPCNSRRILCNTWRYKFAECSEWLAPESSLRKKHKPGDSFDKLMSDLKNPSHVQGPMEKENA